MVCNIDFFKVYNDTYGYSAGNICLQHVVSIIKETVKRPAALMTRYRGEGSAVVLSNTDAVSGVPVAEEIRARVGALKTNDASSDRSQDMIISLGVAMLVPAQQLSPAPLIALADQALYQVKTAGHECLLLTETLRERHRPKGRSRYSTATARVPEISRQL